MKKNYLTLLLVLTVSLFSQSVDILEIGMKPLLELQIGEGSFQLGEVYEPEGMSTELVMDLVIQNGRYIISDTQNHRMVELDKEFKNFKISENRYHTGFINFDNEKLLLTDYEGTYTELFNYETNELLLEIKEIIPYKDYFIQNNLIPYAFFILEDLLIAETKYNKFVVVNLDIEDGQSYEIVKDDKALSLLNQHNNLNIVENKYLTFNGQLVTRSFQKYFNFYSENFSGQSRDILYNYKDSLRFNGLDSDNNQYWSSGAGSFIFNDSGDLIQIVTTQRDDRSDMYRYSVSSDGDLYKIFKINRKYILRWIKRTW